MGHVIEGGVRMSFMLPGEYVNRRHSEMSSEKLAELRDEIEKQTAAFLRAGGKIKKIPMGHTAIDISKPRR